jgi:hypothetical protein
MGGACSTNVKEEMNTKFWWENLMERDNLEAIGVDGRIILQYILK